MLRVIFLFSYKKSKKNTTTSIVLNSFFESTTLQPFSKIILQSKELQSYFFSVFYAQKEQREVANCVLKDMLHLVCMWRHIRGYPQGGNTTHTNANSSRKNKLLLNFRINQFYKMFGQKKRNIYPTLVKAEYNNRLWHYNWQEEWLYATRFAIRMLISGPKAGGFNPAVLASNQTNGYPRVGKAAKIGKAKKLVKMFTIGVPLLFARYIYMPRPPRDFPKIILKDEVNKKLGRKLRRQER